MDSLWQWRSPAGHNVIAYDVDADVRASVGSKVPTVDEPGLAEEMLTCDSLAVADSVQECVEHSGNSLRDGSNSISSGRQFH